MTVAMAAAIGLGGAVAVCLVFIFLARAVKRVRLRRQEALRPQFELELAAYLADNVAQAPRRPSGKAARAIFRAVALEALAELRGRDREQIGELLHETGIVADTVKELRSPRATVRRRAADALAELRIKVVAEILVGGLDDPDQDVRLACARGLAERGDGAFTAAILEAAEEGLRERPGSVAEILLALGAWSPSALAQALAPRRSGGLRRVAAAVVGELRLSQHAPLLRSALSSEDDELVARAARGLGLIGDAEGVDRLLDLLDERQRPRFVHASAVRALGSIGDTRAIRLLERELRSDSWWVQTNAARALGMLGDGGDAALRRAGTSPGRAARAHAVAALDA